MLDPKNNRFPPASPDLLGPSGKPFLSNINPSVSVDLVSIEPDTEDQFDISVSLCLVQNVKEQYDKNWWFLRKTPRNMKYRVRLIACSGKNSPALDFISQRLNEYQSGLMATEGISGSEAFITKIIQYTPNGTSVVSILNELGPFSVGSLTSKLVGSQSNILRYPQESKLSDIVIMDMPVLESLKRDASGIPAVRLEESLGKASLLPLVFKMPRSFAEKMTTLSLHAFIYYDASPSPGKKQRRQVTFPIQSGMGFVDSKVVLGDRIKYNVQVPGQPANPPGKTSRENSPAKGILIDGRQTLELEQQSPAENLHKDVLDGLKESLRLDKNQRPVSDVIKDKNYFSPLWITRGEKDIGRFLFSFDLRSFLARNSSFPVLYSKDQIADDLIRGGTVMAPNETAEVKYICVKRRQVSFNTSISSNDLGTVTRNKKIEPDYMFPEEIVSIPIKVGSVFLETTKQNEENIDFYQGIDTFEKNRKTQSMSKFQYGVKISVNDPALTYLQRMAADLSSMENNVQRLYELIKNSTPAITGEENPPGGLIVSGHGLANGMGTERVVPYSIIGIDGISAEGMINGIITKYISYSSKFELISSVDPEEDVLMSPLGQALSSLVNQPSVDGLLRLSSYIRGLTSLLEQIINVELPNGARTDGSVRRISLKQRGILQTKYVLLEKEHFFSEVFEYGKTYHLGYDYLSHDPPLDENTKPGLVSYSKQFFEARANEEFNKYFGTYANKGTPSIVADGTQGTYGNSTFSYFTPKTIKTFGRTSLNQPTYINSDINTAQYDINRYAQMFLDILKIRKQTKDFSPFYELPEITEEKDMTTSIKDALLFHDCLFEEGATPQFAQLAPERISRNTANMQEQKSQSIKGKLQLSPDLFQTFLGGKSDESKNAKSFISLTDIPFKPKNFGIPSAKDEDADRKSKKSLPPVKLMFNILGELETSPIETKSEKKYEEKTFNSLINSGKEIDVSAENIQSLIEGRYSQMPNQFKSMFIIANIADRMSFGTGFDAVRFKLEDEDISTVDKMISNIYPGDTFPPYKNVKDPMKVYAKFLTFWMNYKQIAVLEYLSGFESLEESGAARSDSQDKRGLPTWKKFTVDFYRENLDKRFICRMRDLTKQDVGTMIPIDEVGLFDLPIYNRYFILEPAEG